MRACVCVCVRGGGCVRACEWAVKGGHSQNFVHLLLEDASLTPQLPTLCFQPAIVFLNKMPLKLLKLPHTDTLCHTPFRLTHIVHCIIPTFICRKASREHTSSACCERASDA